MWFLFGEVSSSSRCLGWAILLWHSLSLPYNHYACATGDENSSPSLPVIEPGSSNSKAYTLQGSLKAVLWLSIGFRVLRPRFDPRQERKRIFPLLLYLALHVGGNLTGVLKFRSTHSTMSLYMPVIGVLGPRFTSRYSSVTRVAS